MNNFEPPIDMEPGTPQFDYLLKRALQRGFDPYAPSPYDGPALGGISPITLERLRVTVQNSVSRQVIEDFYANGRMQQFEDYMRQTVDRQITSYFWAHRIDHTVIEHPKTWLDAVKIRFLPKRLLKRFPPVYTKHIIDTKAVYPGLRLYDVEAHPFREMVTTFHQERPQYITQDEVTQYLNPNAELPGPRFNDPRYRWVPNENSDGTPHVKG